MSAPPLDVVDGEFDHIFVADSGHFVRLELAWSLFLPLWRGQGCAHAAESDDGDAVGFHKLESVRNLDRFFGFRHMLYCRLGKASLRLRGLSTKLATKLTTKFRRSPRVENPPDPRRKHGRFFGPPCSPWSILYRCAFWLRLCRLRLSAVIYLRRESRAILSLNSNSE